MEDELFRSRQTVQKQPDLGYFLSFFWILSSSKVILSTVFRVNLKFNQA